MTTRETLRRRTRRLYWCFGVSASIIALGACGSDRPTPNEPSVPDGGVAGSGEIKRDGASPADAATRDSGSADAIPPSASDAAACPSDCGPGRACCNGACVDTRNDPHNCGGCGIECPDDKNWCDATDPTHAPFCNAQVACAVDYHPPRLCPGYSAAGLCCGYDCCERDELCCTSTTSPGLSCFKPTKDQPTCPPLPPEWPFGPEVDAGPEPPPLCPVPCTENQFCDDGTCVDLPPSDPLPGDPF